MKMSGRRAIGKQLLPYLPGFVVKDDLVLLPPFAPVLRGFVIEGSSFSKTSLTVVTFVVPPCVPKNYLSLLLSFRIMPDCWDATMPDLVAELGAALKQQAEPFLTRVASLHDLVEVARVRSQTNPHVPRAIAYSLARSGQFAEALEVLDQLLGQVNRAVHWQRDIAEHAERLKAQLIADPQEALRQLQTWEGETLQALGLGEIDGARLTAAKACSSPA